MGIEKARGGRSESFSWAEQAAARQVPITDFLRIKYQGKRNFSPTEYVQLHQAIEIVEHHLLEQTHTKFFAAEPPEPSHERHVLVAREVMKHISLKEYLQVRYIAVKKLYGAHRLNVDLDAGGTRAMRAQEEIKKREEDMQLTEKIMSALHIAVPQ